MLRKYHSATRLPDGRVLVVGGRSDSGYLKTTELYDPTKPAASAWSPGPPTTTAACQHTATLIAGGKVIVAGGWPSGVDATPLLQSYDATSGTWESLTALLGEKRRQHTATLLKNGKILFAGGLRGTTSGNYYYLDSLDVYDPASGLMVQSAAKMTLQRVGHTADLLPDGRVLIVGGVCLSNCKVDEQYVDDLYDPGTDKITPIGPGAGMPSAHASARLLDGRVLIVGGGMGATPETVTLYVPGTGNGAWKTLPPLAFGRIGAEAVTLLDGTVLVAGGQHPDGGVNVYATTLERFYP